MNGIIPPDPLAPEALALLDIDGSKQRAFRESFERMDAYHRQRTNLKLREAVTHRTPAVDKELDRLERKYGLKNLYGE